MGYALWRVAVCLLVLGPGFRPAAAIAADASPNAFGKPTPGNRNPANHITAVRGTRPTGWVDQTRSEILARNGVVAASDPLAAQAGLKILQDGGNAVDAAVATAAMLALVEPNSTGLGAELFAIVWDAKGKKLHQISANGPSPKNYTPATFAANGFDLSGPPYGGPPGTGIFAAMVPGSVDGWDKLLKRFGTMKFKEVLEPARKYAFEGFPVHEVLASGFMDSRSSLCGLGPPFDTDTAAVYCPGGNVPGLYGVFRNPDMGHAFEVLQEKGVDAFYKGEIARAIVAKADSLAPGLWTMDDLNNYQARWEPPLTTRYHGYDIYETPPPSQGWAALEMLNILEQCAEAKSFDLAVLRRESPSRFTHIEVEAKKLAYSDLLRYNADPDFFEELPGFLENRFLDKRYAAGLCDRIDSEDPIAARAADLRGNLPGGTVYLAAADRWGNMVSMVSSVYTSWGSRVTIPGYGFQLGSRGAMFTFSPDHPNTLAGGKRPFITIIAGFIMKDGEPLMAFGNMGGGTQPQAHVQHVVNLIDLGYNVQATSDAARFDHDQWKDRVSLDHSLYDIVNADLTAWGHRTRRSRGVGGGYQGILFERDDRLGVAHQGPVNGVYRAGSELRKDGCAVGW
ncbi:MAG: gamma-glutamyltransferase family protein [Deltaproteobacteria bacterium]|nr:gamma-glutamyltransferase family protein [Deltaproteobacteria bacterium]